MNIQEEISNKLISSLDKKLDETIVEGLRIKGYEFDSEIELHKFIKDHCKIIEVENTQTFYAKGAPFLQFERSTTTSMVGNSITASLGNFSFI